MSKRRKKNSVNPARPKGFPNDPEWRELLEQMRRAGEESLEDARRSLVDSGASEEQIDRLLRVHRCWVAYEGLMAGDKDSFDRIVAPVANEMQIRMMLAGQEGPWWSFLEEL